MLRSCARKFAPILTTFLLLSWLLTGSTCNPKKVKLLYPPPPPNVLLPSPTPNKGTPARAAASAITQFVPPEFIPKTVVRVVSVPRSVIVQTYREDVFTGPNPGSTSDLREYVSFTGHRPGDLTGPDTIYLDQAMSEQDAARWGVHAWGHLCYWLILTDGEREAWRALWLDAFLRHALITNYAKTSPAEGFCEYFVAFCAGEIKSEAARNYFNRLRAARASPLPG